MTGFTTIRFRIAHLPSFIACLRLDQVVEIVQPVVNGTIHQIRHNYDVEVVLRGLCLYPFLLRCLIILFCLMFRSASQCAIYFVQTIIAELEVSLSSWIN